MIDVGSQLMSDRNFWEIPEKEGNCMQRRDIITMKLSESYLRAKELSELRRHNAEKRRRRFESPERTSGIRNPSSISTMHGEILMALHSYQASHQIGALKIQYTLRVFFRTLDTTISRICELFGNSKSTLEPSLHYLVGLMRSLLKVC